MAEGEGGEEDCSFLRTVSDKSLMSLSIRQDIHNSTQENIFDIAC